MAVAADGDQTGTIGGGAVEHRMVNAARRLLDQGTLAATISRQVHDPRATEDRSGMLCGGSQTVVIFPCGNAQLEAIGAILGAIESHQAGVLELTPRQIAFLSGTAPVGTRLCHFGDKQDWVYTETLGLIPTVFIIGGGHVSLALSQVLDMLDFQIVVIDVRPQLVTLIGNPYAHKKLIIPSYSHIGEYISDGDEHYVAIMTHSHRGDETVLSELLGKRLRYLGLIGSRKKIETIFERLRTAMPQEGLNRLYAPLGLPIHSHTPAEIAVSVAAQIIQVKNSVSIGAPAARELLTDYTD